MGSACAAALVPFACVPFACVPFACVPFACVPFVAVLRAAAARRVLVAPAMCAVMSAIVVSPANSVFGSPFRPGNTSDALPASSTIISESKPRSDTRRCDGCSEARGNALTSATRSSSLGSMSSRGSESASAPRLRARDFGDGVNAVAVVHAASRPSGLRLPASGVRLPASGVRLPASGLRPPACGTRRPAYGLGIRCGFRRPACGLRLRACGLQRRARGLRHAALRPAASRRAPRPGAA